MDLSIESIRSYLDEGGPVSWLLAIGLAFFLATVIKGILVLIIGRLTKVADRTSLKFDNLIVELLSGTKTWVLFIWFLSALLPVLHTSERLVKITQAVVIVTTAIQIILWGFRAIRFWRRHHLDVRAADDASSAAAIGLLATSLQGILIVIVVLSALSNMGVDIAALIAGLGIGGIAVALAAQNILGDLLASLSIVLDKPFVIGDFIVVGDFSGNVENIGLKTTRLRSISGEQLIFPNKALLESRVRNYKRMWRRRVVHKFGIHYSTPEEKLRQIPIWIRGFVESDSHLEFDRCHFSGFGESALDFETVYFVKDSAFNLYMDRHQDLLLKMLQKFNEEGILFAYPTRAIQIERVPDIRLDSTIANTSQGS